MSSLLDSPAPLPLGGRPGAVEEKALDITSETDMPGAVPSMLIEERLRAAMRWTPASWILAGSNVLMFAVMAFMQQRLFCFSSHSLLKWGGGFAPRVFGHEWWRAASY